MSPGITPPDPKPVAVVTGAGGGLGQVLVRTLAESGWRVFAGTHLRPLPDFPEGVEPLPLDVTNPVEVIAAALRVESIAGRLDLLVNNAGITADRLLAHLDIEAWDRVLAVNLDGASRCVRAFLPLLVRQSDGHIVNISSHAAHGGAGQAAYAAAKAALLGFTLALARELGPHNVRVNAILPGVLATVMTSDLSRERLVELTAANALGRLNEAGEVARFIVHLASTRNISGQVFSLDSRPSRWA